MLQNKGCHRIYFVFHVATAAGKGQAMSKYEYVPTLIVNVTPFSENAFFIWLRFDLAVMNRSWIKIHCRILIMTVPVRKNL